VVKNAAPGSDDAAKRLHELLHELPFGSASLKTASGRIVSVQLTKRGRAIVHESQAAMETSGTTTADSVSDPLAPLAQLNLRHDRNKALPIPPDQPHPFLQRIGMQTADGRLKAGMVDKMAQVGGRRRQLRLGTDRGQADNINTLHALCMCTRVSGK
jgi:hypothetical protein